MPEVLPTTRIAALPCWQSSVEIEPLPGGMTNRNFLVTDGSADRYVVRVGRDLPEHGVMRFNELAAARAAHAAGISPEVVFAGDGMLVCRFIDGRTLAPGDIREAGNLSAVVALVRRCHDDIPGFFRGPALAFWVFQIIRNYLALLGLESSSTLSAELVRLRRMADTLESAVGPIKLVFGHNDLLAANFLDDGDRLWLIDWDYAGFNSPLFDLANLSSNNGFDDELDQRLLGAYWRDPPDRDRCYGFQAMKCASLLRETLWAAVSELRSGIAFDYGSYCRDYLQRLDVAWDRFQRIPRR